VAAGALPPRAAKIHARRPVTFDNAMLLWHYTVAQGLVGILLVHGFPRLLRWTTA